MKLIRSFQETRIATGASSLAQEESAAALSAMSDVAWRVLIDFRNWPHWSPGLRGLRQKDQESPARGTQLLIENGRSGATCTIDHWDPPKSLHFSLHVLAGEMAYGFTIQENPEESVLLITLEMERSINGLARLLAFILRWQLRRQGADILANLKSRIPSPRG